MVDNQNIKLEIGTRISAIRNRKTFTQKKLSEITGINEKYISRLENGQENPTLDTLLKISPALGISLEDLFKGVQVNYEDTDTLLPQMIVTLMSMSAEEHKFIFNFLNSFKNLR